MKNTKTCPKCGGTEIYTDAGATKRGDRASIPVSTWKFLMVDIYLCVTCGYFEEYIDTKELKDEKTMEKFKENWRKF